MRVLDLAGPWRCVVWVNIVQSARLRAAESLEPGGLDTALEAGSRVDVIAAISGG